MNKLLTLLTSIMLMFIMSCNETGTTSITPEQTIADIEIDNGLKDGELVDSLNSHGCVVYSNTTVSDFNNMYPNILPEEIDGKIDISIEYLSSFDKCEDPIITYSSSSELSYLSSNTLSSNSESSESQPISTTTLNPLAYEGEYVIDSSNVDDIDVIFWYGNDISINWPANTTTTINGGEIISWDNTLTTISVDKTLAADLNYDSTGTIVEWTSYTDGINISEGDTKDSITIYVTQIGNDTINTGSVDIVLNESSDYVFTTEFNNTNVAKYNTTFKMSFAINDFKNIVDPDYATTALMHVQAMGKLNSITLRFTSWTIKMFKLRIVAVYLH